MRKLWRLGFQASVEEVVTCGAALQFVLAERGGRAAPAFVVGSQALVDHVAEAGMRIVNNTEFATRADVVVVAGHDGFDYRELRVATQAVLRGAELIGVTRDRTFPMPDGPWPASGADPRRGRGGHRAARGRAPSASPSRTCTRRRATGSAPGRYLAVGDRLDTDVAGARARRASTARSCSPARRPRAEARRPPTRGPRSWPTRSPRWCSCASVLAPCPRPLCLIVNPSAGGGRARAAAAARRGGAARARARASGSSGRTRSRTRRELARGALARRRGGGGDGRRRAARRGRRRAARHRRRARRAARRARQRLRAQARHRPGPRARPATCSPRGRERAVDVAEAGGRAVPRHRLGGLRLRRAGHRERDAAAARRARLRLRHAARAARLAPRALAGRGRRRGARRSPGTPSPWPTRACSAAACTSCPHASLDDGLLDVVLTARRAEARATSPACRGCSRARHVDDPDLDVPARPRGRVPRRPAVRRLRRRRPDRATCPSRSGSRRAR